MKVMNLSADSQMYTCNVYLVTGSRNAINDVNTLVDVGRDPSVIEILDNAPTGVGKKRVEKVILTHSHYDHASLLPQIRERYNPKVYAYSSSLSGVDFLLKGGEWLKIGDMMFEVIHTPGHSGDSICLYCEKERVLFAGDTTLIINSTDGTYESGFVSALEKLCRRNIETIYFGHGPPMFKRGNKVLRTSLDNVRNSKIL